MALPQLLATSASFHIAVSKEINEFITRSACFAMQVIVIRSNKALDVTAASELSKDEMSIRRNFHIHV